MANSAVEYWEEMYTHPVDDLPWEIKEPPQELEDYFHNHPTVTGQALDVACGTGNFSFYLARQGFKVTAVDFSNNALAIARARNSKLHLPINFQHIDVTQLDKVLAGEKFDFILDYKLLHHLEDEQVRHYAQQFSSLLKKDGELLLVCYSDEDNPNEPFAVGSFGNIMHYRSAGTIRNLYKDLREVKYRKVMIGKRLSHVAHCFTFSKKK